MFKTIFQSLLTRGGVAIFNFLILILSSRYLGLSTRGEVSVMILNLAAIQIINEVVTGYSLVSFIPKINLLRIYKMGISITLLLSIASTFILSAIGKLNSESIWIIIPLTFLVIANTFNLVILLGKQDLKRYNLYSILQPFLLLIGLFVTTRVIGIYTFEGYVYPLFISFFITFCFTTYYALKWIKPKQTGELPWKKIITLGVYCQAAVLMHVLSNRYSYYLLENNAQVGLYSSACSLIESVWVIMAAINPIILSRVANTGDTEESRSLTFTMAKLSIGLSLIACLVVLLVPSHFFTWLLGKSFEGVKSIMMYYIPGILCISFSGIIAHYFSALGQLKRTLVCNSFGFAFTIIASPFLISKWGIEGALLTANISYALSSLALVIAFILYVKLPFSQLINVRADTIRLKTIFKR